LYYQTLRLPTAPPRAPKEPSKAKDDSAYVKGESAISYDDLALPPEKKKVPRGAIIALVLIMVAIAAVCFYFLHVR
jgi:hypothetical protein